VPVCTRRSPARNSAVSREPGTDGLMSAVALVPTPDGAPPKKRRGRPPRDPSLPPEVVRVDVLEHAMNRGKEEKIRALLAAWRRCAVAISREQWQVLTETGSFDRNHHSPVEPYLAKIVGSARRVQMVRYQVVGVLQSFLSNRYNDYLDEVREGGYDEATRAQLRLLGTTKAIHAKTETTLRQKSGKAVVISPEVRRHAEEIMRRVMARHSRPDLSRINMVVDSRGVRIFDWDGRTGFALWAYVKTLTPGVEIQVPLLVTDYFDARGGTRKKTVQINEREDGTLAFGIITDVAGAQTRNRQAYDEKRASGDFVDEVALDWGLRTMFCTDRGDLLGRGFLERLREYDARITKLAAYRQSCGERVRCTRYDGYVTAMRGFLRTEINRVLNRLMVTHAPSRIVVERLDFRSPHLSRRMNRLVQTSGRRAVKQKLQDLKERYGIEIVAVNAAYSSQSCAECGYVDRKNRTGEEFRCRWCGRSVHADVNAPRNLRQRSSQPEVGSVWLSRQAILRVLVRQHTERFQGLRGLARDPRLKNPYFADWTAEVISSGGGRGVQDSPCAPEP
jgi:putative transposase